jgi:lysophospholipase L1-like esterase
MHAILVVLLSLLTAEVSLRAYHQHTLRQRLPADLRVETRALTWKSIQDKYRIVCLGDSITFGEGLSYAEAYPAVLEQLLCQRITRQENQRDIVVINAGVRGSTAVQGLARLERDVLWCRPHAVLVSFGLNDANLGYWPLDPQREAEMLGKYRRKSPIVAFLEQSHLWHTLCARLERSPWFAPAKQNSPMSVVPLPRVSACGFETALERLSVAVSSQGATLYLLTMTPVTDILDDEWNTERRARQMALYDEYNQIIRAVTARSGSYLLDAHAILAQRLPTERARLFQADGIHLTPAGERLLAEGILQALNENVLTGNTNYRRR